ncbi:MAG: helix-turn-helix domain-containing protein [Bellilinea sp.]
MDENSARSLYEQKIQVMIDSLLPYGAGSITDHRLRLALNQIAKTAFSAGKSYALLNLLTAEQAAEEIGISPRRMRALIKTRHDRFGAGMQFGKSWLIHRDELDALRPGPQGWPKGKSRSDAR